MKRRQIYDYETGAFIEVEEVEKNGSLTLVEDDQGNQSWRSDFEFQD